MQPAMSPEQITVVGCADQDGVVGSASVTARRTRSIGPSFSACKR
ncbi:hypothetical protein I551_5551 [Mycobacterium ulcerans str. Harvey]|uniref:Uncharacterized protein n=1 Tax=Mycobacterium ulcerans str. Harvey TaxID=1299332 RepID=A0ABN0QTA9_MYCUL|nr:hypothetical protein I551_5551 [Mycobacterium ulcerans str. Harvey]